MLQETSLPSQIDEITTPTWYIITINMLASVVYKNLLWSFGGIESIDGEIELNDFFKKSVMIMYFSVKVNFTLTIRFFLRFLITDGSIMKNGSCRIKVVKETGFPITAQSLSN